MATQSFQQQAFRKPTSRANRPITGWCVKCESGYGSSELIEKRLQVAKRNMGRQVDDASVFRHIAVPCPFPRSIRQQGVDINVEDIIKVRALLMYQHHLWSHTRSCFKATKRTPDGRTCRMFFPKEVCSETLRTKDNRIELMREPGNEYINAYIQLINDIFKTNHDVKFLAAGEGKYALTLLRHYNGRANHGYSAS